jgi:hypothetical protein
MTDGELSDDPQVLAALVSVELDTRGTGET